MRSFRTCTLCREQDTDLIKYGVRHYAHAACLLKAKGAAAFDLLADHQLRAFPALVAHDHDLLPELERRIGGLDGN